MILLNAFTCFLWKISPIIAFMGVLVVAYILWIIAGISISGVSETFYNDTMQSRILKFGNSYCLQGLFVSKILKRKKWKYWNLYSWGSGEGSDTADYWTNNSKKAFFTSSYNIVEEKFNRRERNLKEKMFECCTSINDKNIILSSNPVIVKEN